ncbi:MAG: hypothetical protein AB7R89_28015 [Dehalococcoidia bacterium]
MTSEPTGNVADEAADFDTLQQQLMVEIGQALIEQSVSGTVALDLVVTQQAEATGVGLDFRLNLERQSGLTVPAAAGDALIEVVQRLVLLWRDHGRAPWRTLTYRLSRGDAGPRFTSEFSF